HADRVRRAAVATCRKPRAGTGKPDAYDRRSDDHTRTGEARHGGTRRSRRRSIEMKKGKLTTTVIASVVTSSLLVLGATRPPTARPDPLLGVITVAPGAGLTDGQTVQVSGSSFQKNRELRILECGPLSDAHPPVYAICSKDSVEVTSDENGAFPAHGFTV